MSLEKQVRVNFGQKAETLEVPNLIQAQLNSFNWFITNGLQELFDEVNPITDYTGKNYELRITGFAFGPPKHSQEECRQHDMTYAAPLRIQTRMHVKTGETAGEIKEVEVFVGDLPIMTPEGTFIINGTERVVVSQLVRSPGVYFTYTEDKLSGRQLYSAKLIPNRGAWLEIETSLKNLVTVKIDRKRKIPITALLRAFGLDTDEQIMQYFASVDDGEHKFIATTLEKDPAKSVNEALIEIYRRVRPGDPPTVENAKNLISQLFFNSRRFDMGRVGRYKLDRKFGKSRTESQKRAEQVEHRILETQDLLNIVQRLIMLNNGQGEGDDIDHLGNRRVRGVGELLQNQFRIGLLRTERIVKERMSIADSTMATPATLINSRPIVAAIKEFFGSSQLSQFMDQVNPLAELTHKRRLSALGPGGLSRERAGFDVRDVHHSHYGRICPIETPEGPSIGLIGSLATYARINDFGFIESPFREVFHSLEVSNSKLKGRILGEEISKLKLKANTILGDKEIAVLKKAKIKTVTIMPWANDEIVYLSADEEDLRNIAQSQINMDETGNILDSHVACRSRHSFRDLPADSIDYMDVSPRQVMSVSTSLIPFLEHDDANRALMGSNMQRQAVPLMVTEAPIVGTGMEKVAALNSSDVILATKAGVVLKAAASPPDNKQKGVIIIAGRHGTNQGILVQNDDKTQSWYGVHKFVRSNQGTTLSQQVLVKPGQRLEVGDVIVDGPSTDNGELALGRNVLVAFMSWDGYNFEDAILLSESIIKDDKYTSIHIEEFEVETRDTKLGPEEITREIPNLSEESLRNLDENGIIFIGAEVGQGDILVGKATPKGESELSAEDRLLRAIFGEKSREARDSSLRVPHGERGIVVNTKIFSRENGDELPVGVNELVRVYVAQKRKISQGDKMAGRHGNKGVVARILPVEDMPFLADGTPVEIVLNPLGVPSRMNLGQVLETHLGYAAQALGMKVATPIFDGVSETKIEDLLKQAKLSPTGKIKLRDGRTGKEFDREVTVGCIYMLKLAHLVEDKIHARSTGPYSLVTQQPLGGKAQFGGQRFGEMEVWALEAYGASHILQEILTIKSDDTIGRVKAYEAIVKGEQTLDSGVPESFRVLVKELEGLGMSVEIQTQDEEELVALEEDDSPDLSYELGINLEHNEREDIRQDDAIPVENKPQGEA